jgi:heme exporter protein A
MTASTAVAPPLLEARALSFYRQDEPVFGPLDFCLLEGEVALVEGDNGSGKTTLLRILAGLLHIDEGSLDWRGQPWRRDEHLGDTLFLGHHMGLKADLSAQENLAVAAGLYGRRDGYTVDGVLLDVGLAGYGSPPARKNAPRWRACCCCRPPCGCSTSPTPTSTAPASNWSTACSPSMPRLAAPHW